MQIQKSNHEDSTVSELRVKDAVLRIGLALSDPTACAPDATILREGQNRVNSTTR